MRGVAGAALLLACTVPAVAEAPVRVSAIDRVWSGHYVGFALVVTADRIFVGYYDAQRQLTIASRPRGADDWTYRKLDSWTGWDSHNSVAMAVDAEGQLHVAANMHRDPLVYFRSERAGDVRSLVRVSTMVSAAAEERVTYPTFLHDGAGRLIFTYRSGGSGNGNQIYVVYDPVSRRWQPLLSSPLADGEGKRNAYFEGPILGPDGFFHLVWVWRDTPDAATNHDLSYARSRDLLHWSAADGKALSLPLRLGEADIVDPVPVRGGIINGNTAIGFDRAGRVTITYHKFDARGRTQIYLARREPRGWHIVQVSAWPDFRWNFGGWGSLDSRLTVTGAKPFGKDQLLVSVVRDGTPIDFHLDPATLRPMREAPRRGAVDPDRAPTAPSGMVTHVLEDPSGVALEWPTRPPHRDLPDADIPDPTVLRLVVPAS